MAKETKTEKPSDNSSSPQLTDFALEDLVPHRGAMLLIDEILEVDDVSAVTKSRVARTWPMADEEGVSPLIFVELAAQTAGVCNGWERIRKLGADSEQIGWLVAVKRADFYMEHLPFGLSITARAENTMIFDKFREVTGRLHHGDQLLAEVVLQLYQA